jgi:hypothetical protein
MEVEKGPQGGTDLAQLHPKSHTESNNTPYCPELKQKANHKPKLRTKLFGE